MLHGVRQTRYCQNGPSQRAYDRRARVRNHFAFGGLCELDSIEEIIYLNDLCDRLGIDTISAGNLAGLTIEAVRQGRIDYPIDYGQAESIAQLIKDIANRQGIGDTLARGIRFAAEEWEMEDQAIHVKGLERPDTILAS